ncbi:hypothetical protein ACFX2A_002392 [Malus domestica]
MSEAIAKLTRIAEEKDLQIATLVNRLEVQDDENPNPKVNSLEKKPAKQMSLWWRKSKRNLSQTKQRHS